MCTCMCVCVGTYGVDIGDFLIECCFLHRAEMFWYSVTNSLPPGKTIADLEKFDKRVDHCFTNIQGDFSLKTCPLY